MKPFLAVTAALTIVALSAPAQAKIPQFSATCPGPKAVEATPKGKVRIDGKQARLREINKNYWEASIPGFTVSVARDGGSLIISYTGKGGANGICQVR